MIYISNFLLTKENLVELKSWNNKKNNNNVLIHFGFNESFIIWVKTLYSNIRTCVMNNGWISEIFKNSVEIMALRIRNNKDIKGFQIKIDEQTHSITISQLADDTALF